MKQTADYVAQIGAMQERSKLLPKRNKSLEIDLEPSMPVWPEHVRAVPNGFLRSALFGVIAKGKRRFAKNEKINALESIEIYYTGERLDQGDLDVWESILHIMHLQKLGRQCRAKSYTLLKLMGKTDTGKNRKILQSRIERLRANAVRMKQERHYFIGGLIDEAYKDDVTQEWIIIVNTKLTALFAADQFTLIDLGIRQALNGHQLAQWLDGFYASHAKPYPFKIETLYHLCGSQAANIWTFTQTLRKALDAIVKTRTKEEFNYEIRSGLVYVTKHATRSQQRHLIKKSQIKDRH